ncbi:leucyl aminopeptidase [Caldalkalibacillus salinus]|uniref:leucyl aminopeptidase n=1 Tax=Caldalkalibacillus salinus TaxID=2803787 RepID=UPI001922EEEB|nr:leucyl aminopeptidase [Caldalkalibacillus salinus]
MEVIGKLQQAEVIIFGLYENNEQTFKTPCFQQVNAIESSLAEYVKAQSHFAEKKKVTVIPIMKGAHVKNVAFIGLGKKENISLRDLDECTAKVTKELKQRQFKHLTYCFDSFTGPDLSDEAVAVSLGESKVVAQYEYHGLKTDQDETASLHGEVVVCHANKDRIERGLHKGKAHAEGVCLARNLMNAPGNYMTPTHLAGEADALAERHDMACDILDKEELEKLGMGALLAVSAGSTEPPKMIVLKYQGKPEWDDVLAFVGKGLTFDSGGISLKPALNMHEMKMDMGGSAAVLGAMETIGHLKPKCNVLAVIPSSENMPSGSAIKPGDVITSLSGKTIEVKNTDAEGRLILADGITYAKQLGAQHLIDVATLTGAMMVALGKVSTGAITNRQSWMDQVLACSQEAREYLWQLPSFDPYQALLKSDVADLNNSPGRMGGAITAGLFLGAFAEDTPWVHLDIAGTAWTDKESERGTKGGTGVMSKTLANVAMQHADK